MPVRHSLRAALATAAVVLTTSTLTLAVQRIPSRPDPKPQNKPPTALRVRRPLPELPNAVPGDLFDAEDDKKASDRVEAQAPPPVTGRHAQNHDNLDRMDPVFVEVPVDPRWIESTKPLPPPSIPDNPPPHEGAMIRSPHIVQPPDLIRIEILEAAPGRPITGPDRLVLPNGKVNLEFYGDLEVAGLTTDQIKVKVILYMRKYLNDVALGLVRLDENGEVVRDGKGRPVVVPPAESEKVFAEITGYNSSVFYVHGEFALPGRLPLTGNDTVLDAINYAGGFSRGADPKSLRLVRPARGKTPARVYKVDYEAIVERGDPTTNYQLFHGDRIFVDRDATVKTAVRFQRLEDTLKIVLVNLFQYYYMISMMDKSLSPAQRQVALKDWADFWWKFAKADGQPLDEKAFREALVRKLMEDTKPAEKPEDVKKK